MSSNKLSLKRSSFLNDFGVFPRGEATGNVKGKILAKYKLCTLCTLQIFRHQSTGVLEHSGTGGLPILLFHPLQPFPSSILLYRSLHINANSASSFHPSLTFLPELSFLKVGPQKVLNLCIMKSLFSRLIFFFSLSA